MKIKKQLDDLKEVCEIKFNEPCISNGRLVRIKFLKDPSTRGNSPIFLKRRMIK